MPRPATNCANSARRARLVAEAVVSAYIHEITPTQPPRVRTSARSHGFANSPKRLDRSPRRGSQVSRVSRQRSGRFTDATSRSPISTPNAGPNG